MLRSPKLNFREPGRIPTVRQSVSCLLMLTLVFLPRQIGTLLWLWLWLWLYVRARLYTNTRSYVQTHARTGHHSLWMCYEVKGGRPSTIQPLTYTNFIPTANPVRFFAILVFENCRPALRDAQHTISFLRKCRTAMLHLRRATRITATKHLFPPMFFVRSYSTIWSLFTSRYTLHGTARHQRHIHTPRPRFPISFLPYYNMDSFRWSQRGICVTYARGGGLKFIIIQRSFFDSDLQGSDGRGRGVLAIPIYTIACILSCV